MIFSKAFKIFIKTILVGAFIIALFTAYANIVVYQAGRQEVYPLEKAPQADAAIVLGAMVFQNGGLSDVLADRVDTGIELYKQGKVKKILMSGDHGQVTYDEVNAMRKYAIDHGVPEADVFMDHAGFATYDSMYRARDVFMVDNAIIVTHDFHLPRALFIAREMGIKASGVSSDKRQYRNIGYLYLREILARTKAVAQVSLGMKPKFLGPAIPISGDGRATKDKN